MIKVDISNIWGSIEFSDLMAIEKEVFAAHAKLEDGTGEGSDSRGWLTLPKRERNAEIERILAAAERIRMQSDIMLVIGVGGSSLSAKGAIELLQGPNRNIGKGKGDPMILFTGSSLSSRHYEELNRLLKDKDFSVAMISKSGSTTEPAIAARILIGMLEEKYGAEGASERIYAVTDPCSGNLRKNADQCGWTSFHIPPSVGGRYSMLTPAGLLPMAAAGIDIMKILNGAMDAKEACSIRSYENPAWLYAAARNLLWRHDASMELIASFEPGFRSFGSWWQQLFAESEGKDGKGLFPIPAEIPGDLHSLGQIIQQGPGRLFETILRFDAPEQSQTIAYTESNRSKLNYLAGKPLDFAEDCAYQSMVEAHTGGNVPIITLECGTLNEEKIGELFYFLQLTCGISAYILGVNPFNQPGNTGYRHRMRQLLRKQDENC